MTTISAAITRRVESAKIIAITAKSVMKSMPFDMPGDFTPIAVVGSTPMVLVVNPGKIPAANHGELLALLKDKPGAYNYASGGNGTILHLATELYLDAVGAKANTSPTRASGRW